MALGLARLEIHDAPLDEDISCLTDGGDEAVAIVSYPGARAEPL